MKPNRPAREVIKRFLRTKQTPKDFARSVIEVMSKSESFPEYREAVLRIDEYNGKVKKINIDSLVDQASIVSRRLLRRYTTVAELVVAAMNVLEIAYEDIVGTIYEHRNPVHAQIAGNMLSNSLRWNVIGRNTQIQQIASSIIRGKSTIITGKSGCGKTSVVRGLCKLMALNRLPQLSNHIVINMETFFQEELQRIVSSQLQGITTPVSLPFTKAAHQNYHPIFFVDEPDSKMWHFINEAGPNVQFIIIVNEADLSKSVKPHNVIFKKSDIVHIPALTKSETIRVVKSMKTRLEERYICTIPDDIIEYAASVSEKFHFEGSQPSRTVNLVENTCTRLRVVIGSKESAHSINIKQLMKERKWKQIRKLAASLTDPQIMQALQVSDPITIKKSDIATTIRSMAKLSERMPVDAISTDTTAILKKLTEHLQKYVYGQDQAIQAVCSGIRRKSLGFADPNKPDSYLFVGPTGVGKTYLSKMVAEVLFGSPEKLVYIDMSEMTEGHAVSKLIGSPPGYVGYGEGGQLTERVYNNPYSVVLLDEFEKSHPRVRNILLQVLDEGRLTDGMQKEVDFRHAIIIMTSNLGTKNSVGGIGFGADTRKIREDTIENAVKEEIPPELRNRISGIVHFNALDADAIASVIRYDLSHVSDRTSYNVSFSENVVEYVIEHSRDNKDVEIFGAREVKRIIERKIYDQLATLIVEKQVIPEQQVLVDIKEDKLTIKVEK